MITEKGHIAQALNLYLLGATKIPQKLRYVLLLSFSLTLSNYCHYCHKNIIIVISTIIFIIITIIDVTILLKFKTMDESRGIRI